jgi:hypothetical protein
VRKDLVCSYDEDRRPLPATPEQVDKVTIIGNTVASAIATYFAPDIQYL